MPFDREAHRQAAVTAYQRVRSLYERFAEAVKSILHHAIPPEFPIHSIEARAKALDSFGEKASKAGAGDLPKYSEPMEQITDLSGVRVITFFPKTVDEVCRVVRQEFDVRESIDKGLELENQDRFGYKSHHFIIALSASRAALPEYRDFSPCCAEIQVRTVLQHAWAEMEHDIQYKSLSGVPSQLRRRFMCLAGMLELADREFQAIQDIDAELRRELKETLTEDLSTVDSATADLVAAAEATEVIAEPSTQTPYMTGSTRALLAKGLFAEAIRAYDALISKGSVTHTSYLGRARAKFLAGDSEGALQDLELARDIFADDPALARLRAQIEEGAVATAEEKERARVEAYAGNSCLSVGDAEGALAHYRRAEELGWAAVYSMFNKAIAHCLAGQYEDMERLLGAREFNEATPYGVTASALRSVALLAGGFGDPEEVATALSAQVKACTGYRYSKSHLRFLEEGLRARDKAASERARRVFDVLREGDASA